MWSYEKNITCEECGKKYELYSMKIPTKDKDTEVCSCGKVLHSWRECRMYDARLIEDKK